MRGFFVQIYKDYAKFLIHHGQVGCTDVKHVEEAVSALDIKLNDDIIKRLEAPYVPHVKSGLF